MLEWGGGIRLEIDFYIVGSMRRELVCWLLLFKDVQEVMEFLWDDFFCGVLFFLLLGRNLGRLGRRFRYI